ncbi:hypothetical protein, partial [Natrinema gari]
TCCCGFSWRDLRGVDIGQIGQIGHVPIRSSYWRGSRRRGWRWVPWRIGHLWHLWWGDRDPVWFSNLDWGPVGLGDSRNLRYFERIDLGDFQWIDIRDFEWVYFWNLERIDVRDFQWID